MIIAIDGPAGSGKSSTARAVADALGFQHLDSGAFYRALTHAALRAGIPLERWPELGRDELDRLDVGARPEGRAFRLTVQGRDVSAEIRSPDVNAHVSQMARLPAVRDWLLEQLRSVARATDLVADGRDIGTVVFPDAELKIFLTAEPRERARRRLVQQGRTRPSEAEIEAEARRLAERDRMDSERATAPLRQAPDAIALDTTKLSFQGQVARILELADTRRSGAEPSRSSP